jgi:hypothetical protein
MVKLVLVDGLLYDPTGQVPYPDADYFTTIEDARRWLDENRAEAIIDGEEEES